MLNKSKYVHLPFGRFPFHSRIHPARCLNYQTYGHNITKCHNPGVCEHCGKDHSFDNCPKTSLSFYVSCFKSKRSCHDHVTTSSSCSLYRQQVRLKMGRTAWEWRSASHPKVQNVPLSTKFALLNPRSTRSKSSIILDTILSLKLDIIALTETWIPENADNVTKYDIVPHGLHVLHSHIPIGKRSGGIFVISRNSIRLDAIKSPSLFFFWIIDSHSVFFTHRLFLSVIYRPPNTGNFICELTSHLYFLYSFSSNFILAGDFKTPNCTSHDNPLSALLRELELVQHIDFPTHRLGNILDLIITLKPNSHLIQDIGRETFDSDHYLFLCSLNLAPPPPLPPRIVISRSFENFVDAVFEKDLRHIHNTLTFLRFQLKSFLQQWTTFNHLSSTIPLSHPHLSLQQSLP